MTKEYIRNCSWGYSCDQKWEKLTATHNSVIKFCESCLREVYRCVNFSSDITDVMNIEPQPIEESKMLTWYPASLAKGKGYKPSTQRATPANSPI
jgi:hypothetical protein